MKTLLILFLGLSVNAMAGVILPPAEYFKTTGSVETFEWAPAYYENDFRYDVLYYIPENLRDEENVKTLIFMHGGGNSTLTREGSLKVATNYIRDMKRLADDLNMAVVVPSASGLNWGGHTVSMIRSLNHLLRKELAVDHNNMGLSGHSMGGMGIGRSFPMLADEFAYFVPTSSGIDVALQNPHHLNKVFNVPYVHLQGLKDHFTIFVERCQEQLRRTMGLEELYGEKSKLEILFYDGAHNYDYNLLKSTIERLQQTPRNLYQPKLYGSLVRNNNIYTENNITFTHRGSPRYFWVELIEATGTNPVRMDFTAKIINNKVFLKYDSRPPEVKHIRILLSEKLLDKENPIHLYVNDDLFLELPKLRSEKIKNQIDPSYEFDDSMDIVWNN